jgi:hypothetical protein
MGARCPFCGSVLHVVAVHGHGQCARCGTNVEPCCTGASAETEADEPGPRGGTVDPRLFRHLWAQLGGEGATVTVECVLQALVRALDAPLDEARVVLDAAIALGHVEAAGDALRLGRAA